MPLQLDNDAEFREAQAALFNVNSQAGWLLFSYVGPQTVHFGAGGEGGPEEIVDNLHDDQIQYGLIRLGGIDEKGTLKTTIRDVMFIWIGPKVGILEKGRKTALQGDALEMLRPYHGSITVYGRKNFNARFILDRSHPLSGSHEIHDEDKQ